MAGNAGGAPQSTKPPAPTTTLIAQIRHELRTPLNAVIGYGEMLLEEAEDAGHPDARAAFEAVLALARQILGVINETVQPGRLLKDASAPAFAAFQAELRDALRGPVASLVRDGTALREQVGDDGPAEFAEDVRKIEAATHRLFNSLEDLLEATPPDLDHGDVAQKASAREEVRQTAESLVRQVDVGGGGKEGGHILVVDDKEANREVLARRLGREGYRVSVAEGGLAALAMVEGCDYDLVLLDIMMPDLNGIEVLRRLKSGEKRDIPVIIISALDELSSVVPCIEMGAEDYLSKPFEPVLLRARIVACLEKKRLRDKEQAYLRQLSVERERSERLLLNILPTAIAERLKGGEAVIADTFPEATVLFADLVGFTRLAADITPAELVRLLNVIFSSFDQLAAHHGLEKIKTIGDAYLVVAGVPEPRADHAEAIARMGLDMVRALDELRILDVRIPALRVGIHSGPVVAGVIGTHKIAFDLWGDAVNTASRMKSYGIAGEVNVSEAVRQRLGDGFVVKNPRQIEMKGKGLMTTYCLALAPRSER